ncbi:sialidase family protein [Archangium lansingense]|uniref:Sialidase family protein n=1 Tax=Archangium lansingense TaxID=2995310 RepID=A0ABT4A8G8_9BACT|nr:sialidase family protein [Archangium lansinium]MCY1077956.1 sialidase family protein [Archangium lansinium]
MGAFRWLWVWVLLAPQAGYAREVFETAGNFSETRANSREPAVAVVGNHVFAAWIDMKTGYGDVYFRQSADRGLTYSAAQKLSDSHARASDVQVARIEGDIYVVWAEEGIRLRASHDFGVTFGPIQVLSARGTAPRIVAMGGNVYVGWRGSERGSDLFFRASHDFGDTFEAPIELSEQAKGSDLSLAAEGDSVYAVWDDGSQVFFRQSMDEGRSFTPTQVLDEGSAASEDASLVAQGTGVYVVWREGSGCASEIAFRRSITRGASFEPILNLSNNAVASLDPLLEVKDAFVYVLWKEKVAGSTDIFFTRSIDTGGTFEAPRNLSQTPGKSSQYALSTSSGFVRIVWRDRSEGGGDIFYRSSADRGASFEETQNLSQSPGKSTSPVIISSGRAAEVHVLWEEDLPGNRESFYRRGVLAP